MLKVVCLEFLSVNDMLSGNETHSAQTADRERLLCWTEPKESLLCTLIHMYVGHESVCWVEKRYR